MNRKFCEFCGNPTLNRVSAELGHDGVLRYFLKRNYQFNNRGTIYSIPVMKGGKKQKDLILREDQKEFQDGMRRWLRYREKSALDPDYAADGLLYGGKAAAHRFAEPMIGYGRKNPNVTNRRIHKKNNNNRS